MHPACILIRYIVVSKCAAARVAAKEAVFTEELAMLNEQQEAAIREISERRRILDLSKNPAESYIQRVRAGDNVDVILREVRETYDRVIVAAARRSLKNRALQPVVALKMKRTGDVLL